MHRSQTHRLSGAVDSPSLVLPDQTPPPTERPERGGRDIARMLRRDVRLIIARPGASGAPGVEAPALARSRGVDRAHGRWNS